MNIYIYIWLVINAVNPTHFLHNFYHPRFHHGINSPKIKIDYLTIIELIYYITR